MLARINRLPVAAFPQLKKTGTSFQGSLLGVLIAENGTDITKAAIVVSTKVSKSAAERNRVKRIIREYLVDNAVNKTPAYDILVFAKYSLSGKTREEIFADLESIFKRLNKK